MAQDEAEAREFDKILRTPSLVASTSDTYCRSIAESKIRENKLKDVESQEQEYTFIKGMKDEELESNYFKSAQWSPDGTSLITSSADNTIRTFILPPTLLESPCPITLSPYTIHTHPTSINCLTAYPLFALSDPTTTLYLSTGIDLPIRLTNALSPTTTPISSYPFISPTTEAYYTPSSLLWSSPGHFLAGTDCLIALFDVSRNGEGPISRMPTIPSKRHKMKGGGVGMRGIVSTLSMQSSSESTEAGMLAAGTWTRWVGLYDMGGLGGAVATWSIGEAADKDAGIGGTGITQTAWSRCGRYLFIVERKSRGVLVYDVRVAGKLVCWLEGRQAETNQRLGIDVFEAEKGTEVWAGGTDGIVRVWEGMGLTEGAQERSWEWRAHYDPVTSAILHSSGTVVATCSGQRSFPSLGDDGSDTGDDDEQISDSESQTSRHSSQASSRSPDNSIKVWSL